MPRDLNGMPVKSVSDHDHDGGAGQTLAPLYDKVKDIHPITDSRKTIMMSQDLQLGDQVSTRTAVQGQTPDGPSDTYGWVGWKFICKHTITTTRFKLLQGHSTSYNSISASVFEVLPDGSLFPLVSLGFMWSPFGDLDGEYNVRAYKLVFQAGKSYIVAGMVDASHRLSSSPVEYNSPDIHVLGKVAHSSVPGDYSEGTNVPLPIHCFEDGVAPWITFEYSIPVTYDHDLYCHDVNARHVRVGNQFQLHVSNNNLLVSRYDPDTHVLDNQTILAPIMALRVSGSLQDMLDMSGMSPGHQFFETEQNKLWYWTGRTWQVPGETAEFHIQGDLSMSVGHAVKIALDTDGSITMTTGLSDVDVIGVVALVIGDYVSIAINGNWPTAVVAGAYRRTKYLITSATPGLSQESETPRGKPFAKILETKDISTNGQTVHAFIHTAEIY